MDKKFLHIFRLGGEKEDYRVIRKTVEKDAVFSGTNLWILFFATLIASLGLNVNSTAVVIGAMLISPLMGPIVGMGVGAETNDLSLIRRSARNYLFAILIGLVASTIYFLLSPLRQAHSEILARTQPTIYDVLIAFFGGFAGAIAISSKLKGNVIPGVAIATALIPPLCTAGYGLATWQLAYFFGAFYLYLINSVFIAAATMITAYLLKFPVKKYEDPEIGKKEKRFVWAIILITLLPSIYLGYQIVKQDQFIQEANRFIDTEANFPGDYLLDSDVDPKNTTITLTFGGKEITESQVSKLKGKLKYYKLPDSSLHIKQGFSYLEYKEKPDQKNELLPALKASEMERIMLQEKMDSIKAIRETGVQVYKELKVNYPGIREAVIQPVTLSTDSIPSGYATYLVLLKFEKKISPEDNKKLENWLKVRLQDKNTRLVVNYESSP